jgi:hypothetical protein
MPLSIEIYDPNPEEDKGRWVPQGLLLPGEITLFKSTNKDGKSEILVFDCKPDDTSTVVYLADEDFSEEGLQNALDKKKNLREIITLKGEEEFPTQGVEMGVNMQFRFKHRPYANKILA